MDPFAEGISEVEKGNAKQSLSSNDPFAEGIGIVEKHIPSPKSNPNILGGSLSSEQSLGVFQQELKQNLEPYAKAHLPTETTIPSIASIKSGGATGTINKPLLDYNVQDLVDAAKSSPPESRDAWLYLSARPQLLTKGAVDAMKKHPERVGELRYWLRKKENKELLNDAMEDHDWAVKEHGALSPIQLLIEHPQFMDPDFKKAKQILSQPFFPKGVPKTAMGLPVVKPQGYLDVAPYWRSVEEEKKKDIRSTPLEAARKWAEAPVLNTIPKKLIPPGSPQEFVAAIPDALYASMIGPAVEDVAAASLAGSPLGMLKGTANLALLGLPGFLGKGKAAASTAKEAPAIAEELAKATPEVKETLQLAPRRVPEVPFPTDAEAGITRAIPFPAKPSAPAAPISQSLSLAERTGPLGTPPKAPSVIRGIPSPWQKGLQLAERPTAPSVHVQAPAPELAGHNPRALQFEPYVKKIHDEAEAFDRVVPKNPIPLIGFREAGGTPQEALQLSQAAAKLPESELVEAAARVKKGKSIPEAIKPEQFASKEEDSIAKAVEKNIKKRARKAKEDQEFAQYFAEQEPKPPAKVASKIPKSKLPETPSDAINKIKTISANSPINRSETQANIRHASKVSEVEHGISQKNIEKSSVKSLIEKTKAKIPATKTLALSDIISPLSKIKGTLAENRAAVNNFLSEAYERFDVPEKEVRDKVLPYLREHLEKGTPIKEILKDARKIKITSIPAILLGGPSLYDQLHKTDPEFRKWADEVSRKQQINQARTYLPLNPFIGVQDNDIEDFVNSFEDMAGMFMPSGDNKDIEQLFGRF